MDAAEACSPMHVAAASPAAIRLASPAVRRLASPAARRPAAAAAAAAQYDNYDSGTAPGFVISPSRRGVLPGSSPQRQAMAATGAAGKMLPPAPRPMPLAAGPGAGGFGFGRAFGGVSPSQQRGMAAAGPRNGGRDTVRALAYLYSHRTGEKMLMSLHHGCFLGMPHESLPDRGARHGGCLLEGGSPAAPACGTLLPTLLHGASWRIEWLGLRGTPWQSLHWGCFDALPQLHDPCQATCCCCCCCCCCCMIPARQPAAAACMTLLRHD